MIKIIINKMFFEFNIFKVKLLRKHHLSKISNFEQLIIFLVPNDNQINGGILSIASIHKEFVKLHSIHKSVVLACTNVYKNPCYFLQFSNFKNDMLVFDFKKIIEKLPATKSLQLYLPELYVENFIFEFENVWTLPNKEVFLKIRDLHINILNQNDLLMPDPRYIERLKSIFNCKITMTVAHKKYATLEKKNQYNLPLHYLSAWLNPQPYDYKKFNQKKNIIVFSPDELSRLSIYYHLSKVDLINIFKDKLANFEIVVINKMSYENYKKLVANCKFMITFGEGLDAYLLETILSGGIAFAIYNDVFFSQDYKNLPTIYHSVDQLFNNIVNDILFYNTESNFDNYNLTLKAICEKEYGYQKYQKRVANFVMGNYDFK